MQQDTLIPGRWRRVIYSLAIPANAFIVAVGWADNRWVLGIVAALNAGGFSLAVANVNRPVDDGGVE